MSLEIERKFLVLDDGWRPNVRRSVRIQQGYFLRKPLLQARTRVIGDKGFITLKSKRSITTRYEFEYEIPEDEAEEIISRFSIGPAIEKTRHEVMYEGLM
jgi:adenylate cyclase